MSVSSTNIRSFSVLKTVSALNKLGMNNSITLHWCPAHSNVPGNDLADKLANLGSDSFPIGPEPFSRFSASYIHNAMDAHLDSLHHTILVSSKPTPDFHFNLILSLFSSKECAIRSTRDETRVLTHIYTGFSYLLYFQHKIRNEPASIWEKCGGEEEPHHISWPVVLLFPSTDLPFLGVSLAQKHWY